MRPLFTTPFFCYKFQGSEREMNIIIKDGEDAHPRIGAQLATSPREIEPVSKMYENNKITGAITQLCVTLFFIAQVMPK